jgi:hypothetical protein
VLGLAGDRARVTADALAVVDDKAVIHLGDSLPTKCAKGTRGDLDRSKL